MNTVVTQGDDHLPLDGKQFEMLIDSIVEVTRQRDRTAMEDGIGRVICRFTGAKTLTIYHLQKKDDGVYVVPALHFADGLAVSASSMNIRPFLLSSNALFSESLSKPFVAGEPEGAGGIKKELIVPLQGARGDLSAFCHLEYARDDINTRRMLPLLLEFYTNFLTLLEDNERDSLTGLLNRKTFDMHSNNIVNTLQKLHQLGSEKSTQVEYCLATLDIDHFKRVNDTYGHIFGDEVLLLFANLMKETFRGNDLLFRFGGEEFVVLLANTDSVHAHVSLDRFRSTVENHEFPRIGKVTVSIGVAAISYEELPRTTLDHADQALYFAKNNGRNQVRVYEELVRARIINEKEIKTGDIELF